MRQVFEWYAEGLSPRDIADEPINDMSLHPVLPTDDGALHDDMAHGPRACCMAIYSMRPGC